jgi:hypothetical protein
MFPKERDDAPEVPTAALIELIHARRGHLSASQRIEGAIAVTARARPVWRWVPPKGRMLAGVLAAAAVMAVTMAMVQRHASHALSYVVDRGNVARGGVIESEPAAEPNVRFSDGSEVSFARKSVAVLRSVDDHGARLSLNEGNAHADVMHRANARWLFDAGPFLITVTGTAFTFGWTGAEERLDVTMERGTVEVSGPLSDGAITLRSGQHLTVRVRERETLIRDLDPPPVDSTPVGAALAAPDPSAAPARGPADKAFVAPAGWGLRSRSTADTDSGSWGTLLANGNFEAIVSQAEQRDLEKCLASASSADLAILADAARYSRHDALAVRALLAQRRRFPSSGPAEDAAFLLGRIEETKHDSRGAVAWYERYLRESANGAYASEALGRRMLLTAQADGDDAARSLATQYLARFAQGTYAARARMLVQGP